MWSDNETTTDLLGFQVHADLIRSVVTDPALLPVVMGVFGDWGSGKSSIMRMLERDLADKRYEDFACLYFNGWTFEGYEDAKTALLTSILIQIGEHKRFGPKLRSQVARLLKHVKLMELAKVGVKHIGVPLAAAAALTGGIGALPVAAALLALSPSPADAKAPKTPEKPGDIDWLDLIRTDPAKPELLQVRKFREDFHKLLAATSIKGLVILIDDLDRCLPERIIDTLEAIKLFVAVPKTAFVIGADPRIIRHAIASRYVMRHMRADGSAADEEYDLVQDYLEKLIQVPYHLPRLSPAEIETYVNLLACQKHLAPDQCSTVLSHWAEKRKGNFYAAYEDASIWEALGPEQAANADLERRLSWSKSVALVLTEGLKGNPRQVKRMLNAMLLRQQLARIAEIVIRDEVLAKLMVLEYAHLARFHELNNWQAAEGGYPASLKKLEDWALAEGDDTGVPEAPNHAEWTTPSVRAWLRIQPALTSVDLRDYYWLARDRTSSTLAGVTMVSPLVRRLFEQLIGDNEGEQHIGMRGASTLGENERGSLLQLLQQQLERHPDQLSGPAALTRLAEQKVGGAASALFESLRKANTRLLDPGVAFRLQALGATDPGLKDAAREVLEYLSKTNTRIGKAAEKALEG